MFAFVLNISDVEVKFLQVPGKDYRVEEQYIVNTLQYSLMNKTNSDKALYLVVSSHKKSRVVLVSDFSDYIKVGAGELKQGRVDVMISRDQLSSYKEPISIQLVDKNRQLVDEFKISFMAPADIGY